MIAANETPSSSGTEPPHWGKPLLIILAVAADTAAVWNLLAAVISSDNVLVSAVVAVSVIAALAGWGLYTRVVRVVKLWQVLLAVLLSVGVAVFTWILLARTGPGDVSIAILTPTTSEQIEGAFHTVTGTISDQEARVFLSVRPLDSASGYWIQQPATVGTNGWTVPAQFGERVIGGDESFEMIALAHTRNFLAARATGTKLEPGQRTELPMNMNRSNIVIVKRVR